MDHSNEFVLAKLAALENLLQFLFLVEYERADDPIAALNAMSERVLDSVAKNTAGRNPPPVALRAAENMNQFLDDVRAGLLSRGHQE